MLQRLTNIHLLSIMMIGVVVFYGSHGVRGTDQYWYIGDTQAIINGNDSRETNIRFPGVVLRDQKLTEPNYILHNGYMLSLTAFVGQFTSAYAAWIALNYLMHVLISVCIFWSAKRFLDNSQSGWVAAVYLVSPVALWQTMNPLLEMSFAVITAFCVLGYSYRQQQGAKYLLSASLAIGVVSHPIFLIPALLWVCFVFVGFRQFRVSELMYALFNTLTIAAAYILKDTLFPSSFQPNLQAIITSAVQGKTNMFWQYSDVQPPIELSFILEKATIALNKHFSLGNFTPFYFFTNIAFVALLYLLVRRPKQQLSMLLPAALFVGLYVGMIVLQQNHHRYQQIIAPVCFVSLSLAACHFPKRYFNVLAGVALCAAMAINVVLAQKSRNDGISEAVDIRTLIADSQWMGANARIVMVDVLPHNPISYSLAPRELLSVRTDLLAPEKIEQAIELFSPTHLISATKLNDEFLSRVLVFVRTSSTAMYGDLFYYTYQ